MEWVRPLSGVSLVVPFYHMVGDAHVPHVSNLYRFRTVAEFKADVEFFVSRFKPVALADIVDALNGKRRLPRSCVHLTFDDGFREMFDVVAPILEHAGMPATFFLNTAFLDGGGLAHYNTLSVLIDEVKKQYERGGAAKGRLESILPPRNGVGSSPRDRVLSIGYGQSALVSSLAELLDFDLSRYIQEKRPILTSKEVAALLQKGFTIGTHSHTHLLYSELALTEQLRQTRVSMKMIEERFGGRLKAFAFPHNDDGIGGEFFRAVFSDPLLDVSFGTSGLVSHFHPRNIERITMEKTAAPAAQILAGQFTRAVYFRLIPH